MVKVIASVTEKEKRLIKNLNGKKLSAHQRYPFLFTLLGTFGLVSVFYGFEGIIDRIKLLSNNPVILLIFGLSLLILTGTLYKKLD